MGLQPLRTQRAQTEQVMPSAKHRCQQARPTGQRGTANLFIQLSRNWTASTASVVAQLEDTLETESE